MDDELEEGQLQDTPLRVMASDEDEFPSESGASEQVSQIPSTLRDDDEMTQLDYENDLDLSRGDGAESMAAESHHIGEGARPKMVMKQDDMLNLGDNGDEWDLGQDDVWYQQERILMENREKRERLRK